MLFGAVQFTWKSDLEDRPFDKLYLVPVFLLLLGPFWWTRLAKEAELATRSNSVLVLVEIRLRCRIHFMEGFTRVHTHIATWLVELKLSQFLPPPP